MIRSVINPWLVAGAVVGAVAISGLSGWQGYRMGFSSSEAKHNAALIEEIKRSQELQQELADSLRARDDLARDLEAQANEDPVVVTQCLGPSRVRRLNNISQNR